MDCMPLPLRRYRHAAAMIAMLSVAKSLWCGGQAEEARKRAGFAVKKPEQPAWMRKHGSSTPARSAPQHGVICAVSAHIADCGVCFDLTWLPPHQLARQCVGQVETETLQTLS